MSDDAREPPRPSLFAGRGLGGGFAWAVTVLFAIAATAKAARRGGGWGTALLVDALAVAYTLLPWIKAAGARREAASGRRREGALTVDDWGVTRIAGEVREAVAWKDLAWVRIYTTSDGPMAEDFFFVLGGKAGTGCLVPNGLATEKRLLAVLQERLAGLDNAAVARASGSVTEAWFTIWTRPSGGGVV